MKRFYLYRTEDETGVSGVGIVAEGAEFENGQAILCWLTEHTSVAIYRSVKELETIHGHGGKTKVVWIDKYNPPVKYHEDRFKRLGF